MTPEQRERARKRSRDWYWKNKERVKRNFASWYAKNSERVIAAARQWTSENPERYKANQTAWRKRVSPKRCEQVVRRRAVTDKATPSWANEFFISEAYDLARRRTISTGHEWHVDHIVPLQSSLVCGLHVENNLCVIPASVNCAKGNRYWPDMP